MKRTKKFTYQGTAVEAEIISEVNVWPHWAPAREVYDSILHDTAGRYYLHRDFEPGERVHLISLTAAIIWATRYLCNGDSRPLYLDASNLLTEGRGVDDPPPFPYMTREEWQATDEYKALPEHPLVTLRYVDPKTGKLWDEGDIPRELYDNLQARADKLGVDAAALLVELVKGYFANEAGTAPAAAVADTDNITVPLTLDLKLYAQILAMGEYDERPDFSEIVAFSMRGDVDSWLATPDRPSPKGFLKRWLREHPLDQLAAAAAYPYTHRDSNSWDAEAAGLVDRYLGEFRADDFTTRDVASGCVRFALHLAFAGLHDARVNHQFDKDALFYRWWKGLEGHVKEANAERTGFRSLPIFDQEQLDKFGPEGLARLAREANPEPPYSLAALTNASTRESASLHGLNAAAPEAVSAEEIAAARAEREGQTAPMRDVLADLAAGWRIEGAEKGGRIAKVLAGCADALEAALEGKEGR